MNEANVAPKKNKINSAGCKCFSPPLIEVPSGRAGKYKAFCPSLKSTYKVPLEAGGRVLEEELVDEEQQEARPLGFLGVT
jgi:hypothetical protein